MNDATAIEAKEMTIHELLRCQHVKRWHIVHTDREQTVAEHLWAVTVMGWALAKRMDLPLPFDTWTELLMLHDSTEAITGDLPTPSKRLLVGNGAELGYEYSKTFAALDSWGATYMDGLPNAALKCVDLTEAIRHMDLHGRGAHALSVGELLRGALRAHITKCRDKWPDYHWGCAVQLFNDSLTGPDGWFDGEKL